ncbi:hypothetical protein [Campylobacter sp. RM9328]|uniref:hypothetical protein n=1 Tax=Campylobacter sp. RM9328 TaxID=1705720 RepID=UPI0014760CB2|nr:hypothetical protein [Campylobacter sp. RM9328]
MSDLSHFKGVAVSAPNLTDITDEQTSSHTEHIIKTDLNKLAGYFKESFLKTYQTYPNETDTSELYALYPREFLSACDAKIKELSNFLGFNPKHRSITITLKDESGQVQAVATRRLRDEAGKIIDGKKWIRAQGSINSFIATKFKGDDEAVFIAEGLGEIGIFELLKSDYVAFQNAGEMAKFEFSDQAERITSALKGKIVYCFVDNDEAEQRGADSLYPIIGQVAKELYEVKFKDKPKGYDLRDLITELSHTHAGEIMKDNLKPIKQRGKAGERLLDAIANEIDRVKVRI